MTKRKKRYRLRLWVVVFLFVLFASLFIGGAYYVFHWGQDGQNNEKLQKELEEMADIVEVDDNTIHLPDNEVLVNPSPDKESDYYYYIKVPFMQADFSKLKEKNSDTVGYIKVNNTNINYPVVYSGDNTYYLTHAFDKTKNSAGWVFLDYRNNLDDLSDNTVIYGHGRVDNTVFGSLKKVLTTSWQENKDNYIIRISTPRYNYVYQIFSIYTIEAESYYIMTTFETDEAKQAWIDTMKKRNTAPVDTEVTVEDSILTLSTCKDNNGQRIVVQAKLIKRNERTNS